MGISNFGEMTRLAKVAKPDVCVLTNIGYCHLEDLKDRDGVLKAKTEMFEYINDNGKIVLNVSDKEKISHMDYGTFDVKTSDKYTFEIKYTEPDETEYEYYFTKTVQKYKDEIKYRVGYRVKVSEKPNNPPTDPSESTTATGTE